MPGATGSLVISTAVPPELIGDFTNDGKVDAEDYVVWRRTNGSTGGYNTWRANFGRTVGGSRAGLMYSHW
jgi:hypothetical protein